MIRLLAALIAWLRRAADDASPRERIERDYRAQFGPGHDGETS